MKRRHVLGSLRGVSGYVQDVAGFSLVVEPVLPP